MTRMSQRSSTSEFEKLYRVKHAPSRSFEALGPEMIAFFKNSVQKRQTKLGKIAECWGRLVPPTLNEHCALESFSRGSLTVIVDSSSHLYEMKQLLLAGLQQQLLIACKSTALRKITLKPGRWYAGDNAPSRKIQFSE